MAFVIWLTGLSGSGKSTIAEALSDKFSLLGIKNEILDGDLYRAVLSPRDGYSPEERDEFRRKMIFITELLIKNDIVAILPLLSSSRSVRDEARSKFKDFVEIYLKCSLEECERRDPKGHYKRVRDGGLENFVGIHIPYEEPLNPEIIIETDKLGVDESVSIIYDFLTTKYSETFK